jgi:hypothetical protein
MPRTPESAQESRGSAFKSILLRTLEHIEFVEGGGVPEQPVHVATSKGMIEILPTTTDTIREDIDKAMGKTYPGMFIQSSIEAGD